MKRNTTDKFHLISISLPKTSISYTSHQVSNKTKNSAFHNFQKLPFAHNFHRSFMPDIWSAIRCTIYKYIFIYIQVYQDESNSGNILSKLAEMSNIMFSKLKKLGYITEKQLKQFSYEYRKVTNFGKLYFLSKIHKRSYKVPE